MSSYTSYSFGLKHAKPIHFYVCVRKNHNVEDSSGDVMLPKHLVNPTNHSLVRHLSSYFRPVTFLTWFTTFFVRLPLNGIAALIMAEIEPKHGFLTSLAWSRYNGVDDPLT